MAKPVKERVRKWRERKAKEGGRSLSAWLEPETAEMLRVLQAYYKETTSPLVARAIRSLHEATVGGEETESVIGVESGATTFLEPGEPMADKEPEVEEMETAETVSGGQSGSDALDPLLHDMVNRLDEGVPFKELKSTLLVRWLRERKEQGVSFDVMASQLNGAGIPTLTGKGYWEGRMIPAFLLLSRTDETD